METARELGDKARHATWGKTALVTFPSLQKQAGQSGNLNTRDNQQGYGLVIAGISVAITHLDSSTHRAHVRLPSNPLIQHGGKPTLCVAIKSLGSTVTHRDCSGLTITETTVAVATPSSLLI